ncbi:hypothetical protein OQJ15_04110 [Fluoribacter dumoffii]|uniref:hypothetical protein n=1 Tax=Fluoribacter dumoffii TaxID=463 RepID=UPI002243BFB6|nr:hypothetical protein [Fluoribacter dumoffii]MCW8385489.1 hypothetical protein [Fluoribacter dumoffii]MCW8496215.1 hypothetical protein [Fluoribacter dumoffii]
MLEKKENTVTEQQDIVPELPVELLVHLFSFFNNNEKKVAKGVSHSFKDVIDSFFAHKNLPSTYQAHREGYVSSFLLLPGHRIVFAVVLEKTNSLSSSGLVFFNCEDHQIKEVPLIKECEENGKLTHLHALPNGDLVALLELANQYAPPYILILNGKTGEEKNRILLSQQPGKEYPSLKELQVLSSSHCIALCYSGECFLIDLEKSFTQKITLTHAKKLSKDKYSSWGDRPSQALNIYNLPDGNKLSIMQKLPHDTLGSGGHLTISFFEGSKQQFSNEEDFKTVLYRR